MPRSCYANTRLGIWIAAYCPCCHKTPQATRELQRIGLLYAKGELAFTDCLLFPLWGGNQALSGCIGYDLTQQKHFYLQGFEAPVFNHKALKVYDTVVVCLDIFDALTLYAAGIQNVIAIESPAFLLEHCDTLLTDAKARHLIVTFDHGQTVSKESKQLVQQLKEKQTGLSVSRIKLPKLDGVHQSQPTIPVLPRRRSGRQCRACGL